MSVKRFLLEWCCCFFCKSNERVAPATANESSTNQTFSASTTFHTGGLEISQTQRKKKLAKIISIFTPEDIVSSEFRSPKSHDLKYNCPICFCFFNQILEINCCKNYVCYKCAEGLNQRILNDPKNDVISCPFCSQENIIIQDVDPHAKVRYYTDTPYLSRTPKLTPTNQFCQAEKEDSELPENKKESPDTTQLPNKGIEPIEDFKEDIHDITFASDGMITSKRRRSGEYNSEFQSTQRAYLEASVDFMNRANLSHYVDKNTIKEPQIKEEEDARVPQPESQPHSILKDT